MTTKNYKDKMVHSGKAIRKAAQKGSSRSATGGAASKKNSTAAFRTSTSTRR